MEVLLLMIMQKLLSKTRQAINDFDLIEANDKIAVGLSGGKDSLTLLHILKAYQKFSPTPFELIAITLNLGDIDNTPLKDLCKDLDVPFYEIQTEISKIVFDIRKEKNPCWLCAKLRRGALNTAAMELGCNKVALGHHKDDALETFLMTMFYEGRVNCFSPKSYMEKFNLTVIRPMVYIDEYMIRRSAKEYNYPIIHNPCKADGNTKRQEIKNLISALKPKFPNIKDNLFSALNNSDQLFVWDKEEIKKIK